MIQLLFILINFIDQNYLGVSSFDLMSEPKSNLSRLTASEMSISAKIDCMTNNLPWLGPKSKWASSRFPLECITP